MDLTTIIDPCYPSNIYRTLDKFVLLRVMELGFSKKFRETQYWSFLLNFGSKNLEYAFWTFAKWWIIIIKQSWE